MTDTPCFQHDSYRSDCSACWHDDEPEADSGMDGETVELAAIMWSQLPTGNKTWLGLSTAEKALVCHQFARFRLLSHPPEVSGDARTLAAEIMVAMRQARFPKEYADEAHDEFEALTLVPMLEAALTRAPQVSGDGLLPCPFCAGPVHKRTMGDVAGCFHIGEPHCPVESHRMMTIEQWNHRIRAPSSLGSMSVEERAQQIIDAYRPLGMPQLLPPNSHAAGLKRVATALAQAPRPMNEGEVTDD